MSEQELRLAGQQLINMDKINKEASGVLFQKMNREVLMHWNFIQASSQREYERIDLTGVYEQIIETIHFICQRGRKDAQGLLKNILGMGPEQTLKRGFVIVRDAQGRPIFRSEQLNVGQDINLQFFDGIKPAKGC